jgi:hypothetical protein
MSAHANPDIVTDGLAFIYDTGSGKSYKGQPATNLITSGLPGYFGSGGETLYQKRLYGLESDSGVFQRNYVTNPATSDSSTFNNNGGLYKNFSTSTLNANTEYIQVSFDFYLITPYVRFGASGAGLNGYMQIRSTDNTTNNYGWDTRYSNGSGDDWNNSSNYVGIWQRVSLIIDITADKTPQDINAMYIYYDRFTQGEGIFTNFIITEHTTLPTSPIRYTSGTRSATQGLLDLTGTSTIDISNASFDSNAQMTFDGTDDYINDASFDMGTHTDITLECIIRFNGSLDSADRKVMHYNKTGGTNAVFQLRKGDSASRLMYQAHNGSQWYTMTDTDAIESDTWAHFMITHSGTSAIMYKNGVQSATATMGNLHWTNANNLLIGYRANSEYWKGDIPIMKIYNRALTAAEVLQNYNATKGRFQ